MSIESDSSGWSELLQRNLARRVVLTRSGGSIPWAVFQAGPLAVAYPRFPIGLIEDDFRVLQQLPQVLRELTVAGVDLVRMSAPESLLLAQSDCHLQDPTYLPITLVRALESWSVSRLAAGVRRKFRQAEKSGLVVRPADPEDGALCHELYARSVARQKGSLRYSRAYFTDLCSCASESDVVIVTKALALDGRVAGFLATMRQGDTGFYLHGGYRDDCAAMRPGYFLMRAALESYRDAGSKQFNFLASPPGQPSLLAYKESFGGETFRQVHWQLPLTRLGILARWCLQGLEALRSPRNWLQAWDRKRTSA